MMLVTERLCLRLNQHGYSDAAADLKPTILALAKLEVKAFERKEEYDPNPYAKPKKGKI